MQILKVMAKPALDHGVGYGTAFSTRDVDIHHGVDNPVRCRYGFKLHNYTVVLNV